MRLRSVLLALVCLAAPLAGRADTLDSNTAYLSPFNPYYVGQAFFVGGPAGSASYNDIAFNFFTNGISTPVASGTAFLLSQPYSGSPGNLGSSTAGFIASAVGNGSYYDFASTVTLTAGTKYYLFTNSDGVVSASSLATGNYAYISQGGSFTQDYHSSDFVVTGDVVPSAVTPEPSSAVLLATGLAGAVGTVRRRRA